MPKPRLQVKWIPKKLARASKMIEPVNIDLEAALKLGQRSTDRDVVFNFVQPQGTIQLKIVSVTSDA